MIKVENLQKSYGGNLVVDIPSLEIHKGESVGVVGNNGAGKTTFFRLMLDLILPKQGSIMNKGEYVKGSSHWKNYTGAYLDQSFLIDFLTPEEYFEFLTGVYGLSEGDLDSFYAEYENFFNGEVLEKSKYIRDLSQGNKQKVGITAALMTSPELLILDEPFNGLDPSTQLKLVKKLNELRENRETTLLVSSHDLHHIAEVCDRIIILEKGVVKDEIKTSDRTLDELQSYFNTK